MQLQLSLWKFSHTKRYSRRLSWSLDIWFFRYARGQTDRQTDRHTDNIQLSWS